MVQTKYDVPVRRAFRWASEQKFCETEASQNFQTPSSMAHEGNHISSVPFFFHLRCECLVKGRLYMPNLRYEPHHRICQFTLWNSWL